MKTSMKRLFIATATITTLGVAGLALAQQGPGPGSPKGDCEMGHGERGGKMGERMSMRMQERQTQLKTALKLNASQEAAWNQYQQAMKPPAGPAQRPDPAEWAKLTTPQRLEKMQALHAERQKEMGTRVQAVQQFYATLTPEQQKVFDQMESQGHRRHGGPDEQREHRHS